jgi:hypothetical protein
MEIEAKIDLEIYIDFLLRLGNGQGGTFEVGELRRGASWSGESVGVSANTVSELLRFTRDKLPQFLALTQESLVIDLVVVASKYRRFRSNTSKSFLLPHLLVPLLPPFSAFPSNSIKHPNLFHLISHRHRRD